jgi:hypothetical protein
MVMTAAAWGDLPALDDQENACAAALALKRQLALDVALQWL